MSDILHHLHHAKGSHEHSSHDKADLHETSPPVAVLPVYAMSCGAASAHVELAA